MESQHIIIQIYEIQSPGEAEEMVALGVDHVGSVIVSEDDWQVPAIKETVKRVGDLGARSSLIPLYNNPKSVFRTLDYYQPHIVHFCDALPMGAKDRSERISALIRLQEDIRSRFPKIRIMRSIPIPADGCGPASSIDDLSRLFEPVSDFFLTDTVLMPRDQAEDHGAIQPVNGFVGITGETCSWSTAANLIRSVRIPVVLAGGLSPENVYQGILQASPAGVDSCTRTNAVDSAGRPVRFKKDPEKVRRFVEATRRAEKEMQKQQLINESI